MSNEWKKSRWFNFNLDNVLLHFYDDLLHRNFFAITAKVMKIIFKQIICWICDYDDVMAWNILMGCFCFAIIGGGKKRTSSS